MHGYNSFGYDGCQFLGMSSGWGWLMFIGLIILVAAIVLMVRSRRSVDDSALTILKTMYVKGEITEAEYLKRKSVVQEKR